MKKKYSKKIIYFQFLKKQFSTLIPKISAPALNFDYKSKLQEVIQIKYKVIPAYKIIEEHGPDHDKTFIVGIKINNNQIKGKGKSKKAAEQDAAKKALELLKIIKK